MEAADKEDARSIMLALMRADAKLDTIIYLLTEDEDEMKKKRTRPTAEDWARWKEGERQLAERIAILDRQIESAEKKRSA